MNYLERLWFRSIHRLHELIGLGMICIGIIGIFLDGSGLNILLALGLGSIIILLLEIKGIMNVNQLNQATKTGEL